MKTKRLLEKDVENAVVAYAVRRGCYQRKFTSPTARSVPDRLFIAPNGVTGYLELKRPGEEPTKAQYLEQKRLREAGAPVAWADNIEDGKAFVDRLCALPKLVVKTFTVNGQDPKPTPDADVLN